MIAAARMNAPTPGTGLVLNAAAGQTLADLERADVLKSLAEHGFVLFRGFPGNLEAFNAFVARMSSRISLDPARKFHGKYAQLVDAGVDAVGLHCENGNTPFWPDLCWFDCEKAASRGSQTTVCDGRKVLEQLSPTTRQLFLAQDILYSRNVSEVRWKTYVLYADRSRSSTDGIVLEDLQRLVSTGLKCELKLNEDGSIHYDFQISAARTGVLSQEPAFANSLLGPSYNYEKPRITFVDGSEIPAEVMDEVRRVTEACTVDIDWRDGDVVLIDNTRVMHGRRRIEDTARTIYNALSYI